MSQTSTRSLGDKLETATIRFGVDLVSASRKNIGFLRSVAQAQWLHQTPTVVEAIRRYDELWMPLIADLSAAESKPPMVVPPFDVEWVWFCHTLNPVSYKEYCEKKFSKLIGRPAIFDEENEEYALMRCREIWNRRYPTESFENEANSDSPSHGIFTNEDLFKEVAKQRFLNYKFAEPYRSEVVYLIASRQRYMAFLSLLQNFSDGSSHLVPASDIMVMWLTHQSYPTVYMEDQKALDLEGKMWKVATPWEAPNKNDFEETKKLWDRTFDQPYEKAVGEATLTLEESAAFRSPIYWEESDTDVNYQKYRSMLPRFLLEVCVSVKLRSGINALQKDIKRDFIRLRTVRCHSELKLDKALSSFAFDSWQKSWHLYCEFGTKGVILENRRHGGSNCLKGSKLQDPVTFRWNDLLRAHALTLQMEVSPRMNVVASITPPVQAPYLLKCVPDRVTDDSGAMISDVILKMNHYHPQEGRWLSRTVLDHAGRECFVIRIRVGGGFWRRGGETPSAVKWEDRIIEIREGSWSYVAGSIGKAPEKVVATATPKEAAEQWKAAWSFSTGHELIIQWESSLSVSDLSFCLRNETSADSSVKLLKGRQMQYQVKKTKIISEEMERLADQEGMEGVEEGFLTLVRSTEEDPIGKATGLVNWKLLAVELLPEEDAILMLLLCTTILKSVSEMKKEDVGGLLVRRRLREAKLGTRDWGSVMGHPCSSKDDSPYLQPWYWNAAAVMAYDAKDYVTRQPALIQKQMEGTDKLYKRGIIS